MCVCTQLLLILFHFQQASSNKDTHSESVLPDVQESFSRQDSSVEGKGIVSSSPCAQGGYFMEFFPPDIKQEPSPIRKSKLELSSHSTAQPPAKKQDSTPHPPHQKLSSHATAQPPQKKQKLVGRQSRAQRNVLVKNRMFKRRQARIPHQNISRSKKEVISIEKYVPKQTEEYWIPDLNVTKEDRKILLSSVGWLTDNIVNAAQTVLKAAFPALPGLQDVTRGMLLSYDIEGGEFVQILNNRRGHWITISTIGSPHPTVSVYDSMFRSAGTHVKAQVASLIHTQASDIVLDFMTVQMQSGGADCGLFAIANATALAFGDEPPGKFMYDQEKMRHHLWQCLEKRKMTKLRRLPRSVVTREPFHVYCICRMPEIFHNECWVECSKCKEWYHDTCISIPDSALCRSAVWHCMLC